MFLKVEKRELGVVNMAKVFAELDSNGVVINTITVPDSADENNFSHRHSENGVSWKECSSARVREAQVGGKFNSSENRFELEKPFNSWTQDSTGEWIAPTTKPTEDQSSAMYGVQWNEANTRWHALKKSDVDAANDGDVVSTYYWDNSASTWVEITE